MSWSLIIFVLVVLLALFVLFVIRDAITLDQAKAAAALREFFKRKS